MPRELRLTPDVVLRIALHGDGWRTFRLGRLEDPRVRILDREHPAVIFDRVARRSRRLITAWVIEHQNYLPRDSTFHVSPRARDALLMEGDGAARYTFDDRLTLWGFGVAVDPRLDVTDVELRVGTKGRT